MSGQKYTPGEVANWLNKEASEEDFAEFFVRYFLGWNNSSRNEDSPVTAKDMRNFPLEKLITHLRNSLSEILFSEEIDESAWWKQPQGGK